MSFAMIALASLGWAASAHGENVAISNDHLRVLIEPESNSFSLKAKEAGKDFVKRAHFKSVIVSA